MYKAELGSALCKNNLEKEEVDFNFLDRKSVV